MLAVVGFDLALETALKTVVASLQTKRRPADSFAGLLNQCTKELSRASLGAFPDRAQVEHVHDVRNDIQHKARAPTTTEVSDCRTYTRDALAKLSQQVWVVDFESLSISDLIRHDEIREIITRAETEIEQELWAEAVLHGGEALERALSRVRDALVGRRRGSFTKIAAAGTRGIEGDSDLTRAFERMQDTLRLTVLGIDYAEYMSWRAVTGEIQWTFGGPATRFRGSVSPSHDEAVFVVAYATDTIIRIEEQVGNLDAPFGREWW